MSAELARSFTTVPEANGGPTGQDDLAGQVRAWITKRLAADKVLEAWQALETELIHQYGCITPREASRRSIPQGTAMRLLDLQYRAMSRELERAAAKLCLMTPARATDALAKIELGLEMQGGDPEDEASTLVRDGARELRNFLCNEPAEGNLVTSIDGMSEPPKKHRVGAQDE